MDPTLKDIIVDWLTERNYKLDLRGLFMGKHLYVIIHQECFPPILSGPGTAMMISEDKIQLGEYLSLSNQMGSKPLSLDNYIIEISAADPEFFQKLSTVLNRQTIHMTSTTSEVYVHDCFVDGSNFPNGDAFITFL